MLDDSVQCRACTHHDELLAKTSPPNHSIFTYEILPLGCRDEWFAKMPCLRGPMSSRDTPLGSLPREGNWPFLTVVVVSLGTERTDEGLNMQVNVQNVCQSRGDHMPRHAIESSPYT
jgi:hypothetical protein